MSSKTEKSPFVSERVPGVNQILARLALESQGPHAQLRMYQEAFREAVRTLLDEPILELLSLMEEAFARAASIPSETAEWECAQARRAQGKIDLRTYLMEEYWNLPAWTHREARGRILSLIAQRWRPADRSEESVDTFRFLMAVFETPRKYRDQSWMSNWEVRAQELERKPHKEEQKVVLEVLRQRAKDTYPKLGEEKDFDIHYFWMCQRLVPQAFCEVLAEERARQGGLTLALRDASHVKFLKPFHLDERSEAARDLVTSLFARAKELDEAREALHDRIQPKGDHSGEWRHTGMGPFGERDRQIGASEIVVGRVEFSLPGLSRLIVRVSVPRDCSEELVRDVAGRARRHIMAWRKEYRRTVGVLLIVSDEESRAVFVEDFEARR